MKVSLLDKSLKILLLAALAFTLLYFGKPFLVPLLLAALLAMLLLPLCSRFEQHMKKSIAVLLCVVLLLVVIGIIIFVISLQVADIADHASTLEKNVTQKFNELRQFASETLGIAPQKQDQLMQQQQQSSSGRLSTVLTKLPLAIGGFLTDFLIVMVYLFLFLLFRSRFHQFVLKLTPTADRENAKDIMHNVRLVAQKYLSGLAAMIACLWVMYSIGFSIVGVENFFFFAILCGLLEIIPFVGNLTGVAVTLLMTVAQGGSTNMLIGILVVYAIVQFSQSYLLEPLVVGSEISINPVFTIVGIVGGELLWGIPGMVLALPLLGIFKIICDHIETLKPWGYLIGDDKKTGSGGFAKLKKLFRKKG